MYTLIKTYQFKLYQSRKLKCLEACIDLADEIWNWGFTLHRRYYMATKKYISANRVKMLNTKLKHLERDVNAAINIRETGLVRLAETA